VKLRITGADRLVQLDGIVVREIRPGWAALEVPNLERWEHPLSWLTPQQRQRVESAVFYKLLQEHVSRRFLAGRSGAG